MGTLTTPGVCEVVIYKHVEGKYRFFHKDAYECELTAEVTSGHSSPCLEFRLLAIFLKWQEVLLVDGVFVCSRLFLYSANIKETSR